MVVFKFNPAEMGLRKTLREYEEIALRCARALCFYAEGSKKQNPLAILSVTHRARFFPSCERTHFKKKL